MSSHSVSAVPPLFQIVAAVTRKRPGHPDDRSMVARQRITLAQAIRAYTINGAYQGRFLHEVPVLLTLMDGKARHDALRG